MDKYLFILGRNWRLALAEIDALLRTDTYKGYITDYSTNCAVMEFDTYDQEENLRKVGDMMVQLGSVQKIGIMYDFIDIETIRDAYPEVMRGNRPATYPAREHIEAVLKDVLAEVFPKVKKKKRFVDN